MADGCKVLIVEDDENTRVKLGDAINNSRRYNLVGSHSTIKQAEIGIQNSRPDVVLVDLGLPDGSGVDLIRGVTQDFDDIRILVISVFGDERHVVDAIEAGARGYLLKDGDENQITEAIDQLMDGGAPITPSVAVYLLKRFHQDEKEPMAEMTGPVLTKREQEVLQLIAKGLTYSEVSDLLNVSINTLRVHMKNLFRKLAVHSRSEAVFEAVEKGILKL